MSYTRATQYYYQGTYDTKAALYNKIKPFIDKTAGFLMQPTDVRFNITFDSTQPQNVLERGQTAAEMLSNDFRQSDSDVKFAEAVVWSLVNGCQILKVTPTSLTGHGFRVDPIHPQNFGVLSETTLALEEQEVLCHITFPTVTKLRADLESIRHPRADEIINRVLQTRQQDRDEEEPTYFHQMVVGGLQPLGNIGDPSSAPSAAGIVNVFPVPTPWRPRRRVSQTIRHCELWVKDRDAKGEDYSVVQLIYPDIIIEGDQTRRNIGKIPGRAPFIKVQPQATPGYFWGRTAVADVQMLQDVLNKRLRDLKVMWDRNAAAPYALSGFTGVTEEMYFKVINEGGFLFDPNPNAKAQKLMEPPPENYLEELQYLDKLFDDASGFSPIMGGQGEPGVRAGVHAQTLVRTSSGRLIDQAARIERQLAEVGYLGFRIMQAMDDLIYTTENGIDFFLHQIPEPFQVEVDSHSASPAFAEDNRQLAIALARAGVVDGEDLIHMLHPPQSQILLANFKRRQKQQAAAAQEDKAEEIVRDVIGIPSRQAGGRRRR